MCKFWDCFGWEISIAFAFNNTQFLFLKLNDKTFYFYEELFLELCGQKRILKSRYLFTCKKFEYGVLIYENVVKLKTQK